MEGQEGAPKNIERKVETPKPKQESREKVKPQSYTPLDVEKFHGLHNARETIERETPHPRTLVVLGLNWENDHMSREARKNVLAAGLLFKEGAIDQIVFSGGKTRGEDNPSEAAAMKERLHTIFGKKIPEDAVVVEEDSISTRDNAKKVGELLKKQKANKNVLLLTSQAHLPRAEGIFKHLGFDVTAAHSAEEIFKKQGSMDESGKADARSARYTAMVDKYEKSERKVAREKKEKLISKIRKIDPGDRVSHVLARLDKLAGFKSTKR